MFVIKTLLIQLRFSIPVSAQLGYEGRRPPGVVGVVGGGRPGGIIGNVIGGIIDRTRDIIGPHIGRDECYRNEVPSYWNGRIDTCSYRDPHCYDRRARCRITRGRRGICCEPRRQRRNRCYDGSRGLGSCYNDLECNREFGRGYQCQFRRSSLGRCCPRQVPVLF